MNLLRRLYLWKPSWQRSCCQNHPDALLVCKVLKPGFYVTNRGTVEIENHSTVRLPVSLAVELKSVGAVGAWEFH